MVIIESIYKAILHHSINQSCVPKPGTRPHVDTVFSLKYKYFSQSEVKALDTMFSPKYKDSWCITVIRESTAQFENQIKPVYYVLKSSILFARTACKEKYRFSVWVQLY